MQFSVTPPFPDLKIRIFAACLDFLLILILSETCRRGYFGTTLAQLSTPWLLSLFSTVYVLSGYWIFSSTYAKLILGMRVVSESGHKMRLGQSCIRAAAMVIGALPIFLGYFYAVTNERKQGFHDKLARTLVIFDES